MTAESQPTMCMTQRECARIKSYQHPLETKIQTSSITLGPVAFICVNIKFKKKEEEDMGAVMTQKDRQTWDANFTESLK